VLRAWPLAWPSPSGPLGRGWSCGELVADVVPHGAEPGPGLFDVGCVGGLGAVGGVVEDHGVFAHQVVDVARAAVGDAGERALLRRARTGCLVCGGTGRAA
jgi:hypothetical protein